MIIKRRNKLTTKQADELNKVFQLGKYSPDYESSFSQFRRKFKLLWKYIFKHQKMDPNNNGMT